MSAGALVLKLTAALAISVGVFFASMSIALVVRGDDQRSANTIVTESPPTTVVAAVTESSNSADPVVVATTAPPIAVPSSTGPVMATATPPLLFRTQIEPLQSLDEVFASVVDDLESRITIPVRLPADFGFDDAELIANGLVDSDSYLIHVERNCNDDTTCRIATFTAQRSTLSSPQPGTGGTAVPLPNGLMGRFSDGTCGEGCNNAFITWIEDDVRYSVGSNVVSGTEVLDLAWRSIDRSLPSPTGPDVCGPGHPKHDGAVATVLTTNVATGDSSAPVNWVAVCSALGIDVEVIAVPGTVRWNDVDQNGEHDLVVTHEDASSTIFVVDENRPRAVIDLQTAQRLLVGELACADIDGQRRAIDASTGEILEFSSPLTVRRMTPERGASVVAVDCPR